MPPARHSRTRNLLNLCITVGQMVLPYYDKTLVRTSALTGAAYVEELREGHERRAYETFRMPQTVFESLCLWLRNGHHLQDSRGMSVEEAVAIFLYIVGRGASNRDAQERFQHSGETISRHFHRVLNALLPLYVLEVRLPDTDKVPSRIRRDPKMYPFFEKALGAGDGSHISVKVPVEKIKPYRNRKGTVSTNMLGCCDFDMFFTYVLPGWEGSANDGMVLNDVFLKGFSIPEGFYYLFDGGYALAKNALVPYRGVRYHLREQAKAAQRPRTPQELFNLRHAQLRNVVERLFGVWKKRFKILNTPLEFDFETVNKLLYVLAGLHNYIRRKMYGREDRFYQRADKKLSREAERKARQEEQRGRRGKTSRNTSQGAVSDAISAAKRERIANRMWTQYQDMKIQRDL